MGILIRKAAKRLYQSNLTAKTLTFIQNELMGYR